MSILAKAKQLNNGYFLLPYALMGKAPEEKPKAVKIPFAAPSDDVQTDNGYKAFIPKDKTRFTSSARSLLGKIHTENFIFAQKAELPYSKITEKLGHSSRTTASNLKELETVLEKPVKSTYHINVEYNGKPFILCYEFLLTEELQLDEGRAPVQLTDLEAHFVSMVVNNKLNPKKSEDYVASVRNVEKALNIPHSTAQSLIDRLIDKGVCTSYRQYTDANGTVITVKGEKAKTKKEKTLLTVHSRIIRRCNVIYKEYKKRFNERIRQRDVLKRRSKNAPPLENQEPPKELTDEEKFDVIEAKFIRDKKYLHLTEKYKALKAQSVEAFIKEKDEAKGDALDEAAKDTFNELCYYLHDNGIKREQFPATFARLIRRI